MKIQLDKFQEKAVNINDKNVLVVAAPGSGKTTGRCGRSDRGKYYRTPPQL